MNHRELLAELRRLFAEEQKVQWRIGDLLVQEFGSPLGETGHSTGALDQIEELSRELGVALGTLLEYRRIAATFPNNVRTSFSWSAHKAASAAADPVKVMADVTRAAEAEAHRQTELQGRPQKPHVTVPLVREIAAQPKHQKPTAARLSARSAARQAPGGWGLDLLSAIDGTTSNLRRIVTMLQGCDRDEHLTEKTERMLLAAMNRCEGQISWIRAFVRGEDVADEIAEFLQEQV